MAELEKGQPKSFAAGIDVIYADVLDSARKTLGPIPHHTHALVFLVEYTRDPTPSEPGTDWFTDSQAQRAGLLAANTAILLSSYIRLLGYEARAHTVTSSDVDLNKLAVAAGLAHVTADGDAIENPYVGRRFGLAAVTTTLALAPDLPLAAPRLADRLRSHGPAWWLGKGTTKNAFNNVPYSRRPFHLGAYPFEKLNRRDETTTFIDEPRVPRFPKRADFFARAVFGDMGKEMQNNAKGGFYVQKSAIGACARRALGALLLLQFGEARGPISSSVVRSRAQRRECEGRVLLHGDRRRRALALSGMGLLQPRRCRQRDEAVSQECGVDALRPGARDLRGRQRRRLDLRGAKHARLSALLASGRRDRRADSQARLFGARAYRAGWRRAAAAAAAAVRTWAKSRASAR